jgi:hypothetical protein
VTVTEEAVIMVRAAPQSVIEMPVIEMPVIEMPASASNQEASSGGAGGATARRASTVARMAGRRAASVRQTA